MRYMCVFTNHKHYAWYFRWKGGLWLSYMHTITSRDGTRAHLLLLLLFSIGSAKKKAKKCWENAQIITRQAHIINEINENTRETKKKKNFYIFFVCLFVVRLLLLFVVNIYNIGFDPVCIVWLELSRQICV